jgi:hypothetical protein
MTIAFDIFGEQAAIFQFTYSGSSTSQVLREAKQVLRSG